MSARYAAPAVLAALVFGASTPFAKLLVGEMPPQLLAGLLYLGSGIGLGLALCLRRVAGPTARASEATYHIPRGDRPWLAGAVVAGGVFGPALLMAGLTLTDAAPAALLLNLEGVLAVLIAWLVFKENIDRPIALGMTAIAAGAVLLSWQPGAARVSWGATLIAGACLCWAVDNNLTRKVSGNDAMFVACLKGLVAGACNTGLGVLLSPSSPSLGSIAAALSVGFAGYGISLALFVVALRSLGTARTGAYFSVAPLFGVAIASFIWPQWPTWTFWLATTLMALGVWLHLRERHEHSHTHRPLAHRHSHSHDVHHEHAHGFAWDGSEPHLHAHRHEALTHQHVHLPDLHHRHEH
ncbi:MAG: EamA family transporter [Pseudomonadota bacterium]|nr:EamA family transporter [Pseudomonadota bacterium]